MQVNFLSDVSSVSQAKKAKLSVEMKALDDSISSSPDLPHKIPARLRTKQDDVIDEELDDWCEKTNLYGVKFVMWFEVGIEMRRIGEVRVWI